MIETLRKIISPILVSLMIALSAVFGTGRSASLTALEKNVTEGLLNGTLPLFSGSDIASGETLLSLTEADENGDLRFVDVDYANQDRSSWKTARHLARTERLAVLFRNETDPQTKAVYKDAVLRLLDH